MKYINNERVCTVEGCKSKHYARGYCNKHYKRVKKYGSTDLPQRKERKCTYVGCRNKHYVKGYCIKHHTRFINHGDASYVQDRKVRGICKVEGCKKDIYIKGHCTLHYQRKRLHGCVEYSQTDRNPPSQCTVEGCKREYFAKGMCKIHYDRIKKREYLSTEEGRERSRLDCQKRRARKANAPFNDYSLKQWQECLRHFDNRCAYCGGSHDSLNQEHVLPISRGGSNTKSNILPSCGSCNSTKGTRTLFEWYQSSEHFSSERKEKIINYLGYKKYEDNIQIQLF